MLVASIEQADAVGVLPDWARPPGRAVVARPADAGPAAAGRAWPGTWASPRTPSGSGSPTIDVVRALAAAVGPLATTSANRHGEPTPPTAAAAAAVLTGPPDLVVDGGGATGVASTVVDATGPAPVVLRAGPIELEL